ncbi:MAG: hypothetical protein ABR499_01165 [Gemmatimonadaceae bacterium]
MTTTRRCAARLAAHVALVAITACTSEDVGNRDKSGTGATTGTGSQAAGGAAGIDTAGGRVTTDRAGSAVAPGPGKIPGTPGTTAADSPAAKTRSARP